MEVGRCSHAVGQKVKHRIASHSLFCLLNDMYQMQGWTYRLLLSEKKEPVAQRHQVVSDTLALLLFIGVDLPWGSRAAATIGDKVL